MLQRNSSILGSGLSSSSRILLPRRPMTNIAFGSQKILVPMATIDLAPNGTGMVIKTATVTTRTVVMVVTITNRTTSPKRTVIKPTATVTAKRIEMLMTTAMVAMPTTNNLMVRVVKMYRLQYGFRVSHCGTLGGTKH